MNRAGILGGALAVMFLLPATAQEPLDGHTFLPLERWGKLEPADEGQRFYAEGRWLECSGSEVLLLDLSEGQRGFFYIDPNSRLQRLLTQDLTPARTNLLRRKSKARLFGTARKVGGRLVVEVSSVEALVSDSERLVAGLNALGMDDPAPYSALAEEAQQLAERYGDDELRALAEAISRRQAQVEAALIDLEDTQAVLDLAKHLQGVKDRLGAIALLARAEVAATEEAQKERLRAQLKALGATQTGGQWRSYEAFKSDEGFVQTADKRWVRPSTIEFTQVILEELEAQKGKLVIVRENPVDAARAANSGRLKRGQNAAEARVAVGMPARVEHRTRKNQLGEEVLWTQWVTEDGRRAYFMNGEVVRAIPADTPWLREQ
ncbi:MAG: hypothetical protein KDD82_09225 [Planctomycetes bacterium]|nr:hypothetical protein [Planctomycetota bacterium]